MHKRWYITKYQVISNTDDKITGIRGKERIGATFTGSAWCRKLRSKGRSTLIRVVKSYMDVADKENTSHSEFRAHIEE